MPEYVVVGTQPIEVDEQWRQPGDRFVTDAPVDFFLTIGAVHLVTGHGAQVADLPSAPQSPRDVDLDEERP